jgi:hypothetical protein
VEERDREFPSWRRRDVQNWSRLRFYPGAFLFLFTRMFVFLLSIALMALPLYISHIGKSYDEPISGWRLTLQRISWRCWSSFALFLHSYSLEVNEHSTDKINYSKYLGPDWKQKQFKGKRVSTIIGNHHSYLDHILVMYFPEV